MIRLADPAHDGAACAAIYAPFVSDGWVSFELDPPNESEMAERIARYAESHGWLFAEAGGAVTAFTRSLSEKLIGDGIRVNAVAPGPIWTPLNPCGGASKEKLAHFGESTPMKRPGEPSEVAPAFLFLACEDSSYMSGQVLHPNGGTIVNG